MRAEQIIDMQADLLSRFKNKDFADVSESILSGLNEHRERGEYLTSILPHQIEAAYAYHVTEDMTDLVRHAAMVLDDEDIFDSSIAPTGAGIVRFDKPLLVKDPRGMTMKVHWLTWGPGRVDRQTVFGQSVEESVTIISEWNDTADPDDVAKKIAEDFRLQNKGFARLEAILGRWGLIGCTIARRASVGPSEIEVPEDYRQRIIDDGDEPTGNFTNVERYLYALWLLLDQTVAQTSQPAIRSTTAKRARIAGIPGRVTVIDLRRIEGASRSEGESSVEWRHRWVVRGHWRWVACGAGRTLRRRVWVAPHVKGPEGKPIMVSDKVYSLRR